MSRIDPYTVGLNGNGRTASGIADLQARVAKLERGGGGISVGGGGGLVSTVDDTTNVALDVTSGELTANIPTTATPQVQSLGVGVAASATAGYAQVTRLGIGSHPTGFPLQVEAAGALAYYRGLGVYTQVWLDTDTVNMQATFLLRDQGVNKWRFGKQTAGDFMIENVATTNIPFLIDDVTDLITVGFPMDAGGTNSINNVIANYVGSTTNGLNVRGTAGDDITSDKTNDGTDSFFYNEICTIVHADKGSANSIHGRVYMNPYSGGGDVYGEGYGGLFSAFTSRRGASAAGLECGLTIYGPTDFSFLSQIMDPVHTGPARGAAISAVLHERNAIADYDGTIFGTNSPWTSTGSRGFSIFSTGNFRGGTGIYIAGQHAANNDEFGVSGTDNREWEDALVINVGTDFNPQALGTDIYTIDGLGRTTAQVGAAHVIRSYSAYGDTQPRWRINYDGKIEWGVGGSTAVDASLYHPSTGNLRTDVNFTIGGNLFLGFAMDALSSATPVLVSQNYVASTTGGINVRGSAGDDITKDFSCTGADSAWFNQVNQIIHADRGSANSIVGRVFLNPFSGSAVYGEGIGGLFSCLAARKGGLSIGIECGVTVYHPTLDSSSGSTVINATYTGPARAAVASFILNEHNAYADYTGGAAIFGTNSPWTLTGSRGVSIHSTGPFRGGTGVLIAGYHAANYTSSGGTPGTPDTREWERALVVNVSSDFDTQATGTDVFLIDGLGRATAQVGAGHIIRSFSAYADANARFSIQFDGKIQWGTGGGVSLTDASSGVSLYKVADTSGAPTKNLRTNANFVIDGTLALAGNLTTNLVAPVHFMSAVYFLVSGVTGSTTDGYIDFTEVATTVAQPAADHFRLFAKDDGAGNTDFHVRFRNNDRIIRRDVAPATYAETNVTPDRAFDATTVALPELAHVVGALIQDLRKDGAVA